MLAKTIRPPLPAAPDLDRHASASLKIDQQRRDPGCTALPAHTMPHGTRRPGTGKATARAAPINALITRHPRRFRAKRRPEAFQRVSPTQSLAPDPGAKPSPGANPTADAILGVAVTRWLGTKSCPRRAAARQRPAVVAFASRETSQARAYLGLPKLGPSSKGGDPVSHCLSPRSPASVSWILASVGVQDV